MGIIRYIGIGIFAIGLILLIRALINAKKCGYKEALAEYKAITQDGYLSSANREIQAPKSVLKSAPINTISASAKMSEEAAQRIQQVKEELAEEKKQKRKLSKKAAPPVQEKQEVIDTEPQEPVAVISDDPRSEEKTAVLPQAEADTAVLAQEQEDSTAILNTEDSSDTAILFNQKEEEIIEDTSTYTQILTQKIEEAKEESLIALKNFGEAVLKGEDVNTEDKTAVLENTSRTAVLEDPKTAVLEIKNGLKAP